MKLPITVFPKLVGSADIVAKAAAQLRALRTALDGADIEPRARGEAWAAGATHVFAEAAVEAAFRCAGACPVASERRAKNDAWPGVIARAMRARDEGEGEGDCVDWEDTIAAFIESCIVNADDQPVWSNRSPLG